MLIIRRIFGIGFPDEDAMNMELADVTEMSIQQPEISNQIEKDVPVSSTSNLTLPDLIVIQRRVFSDEEKEILKKLDQYT